MTKVLLVSERSLFSQGIQDLLRVEESIDFVGRWARSDGLQSCVQACRPDVVLVDCADPADCPVHKLIACLRGGLVQRITCISPDENMVFVLSGERRAMRELKDLVHAIRGQAVTAGGVEPHRCPQQSAALAKEANLGSNQRADGTNDDDDPKQIGGFNG